MYMCIRRYKTDSNLVDEVMKQVEKSFLPQVSQIPGFISYYGVDSGDGVVAFVNIFQSEEGAEQSNRLATKWVKENLSSYFPMPADITAGMVKVIGGKEP